MKASEVLEIAKKARLAKAAGGQQVRGGVLKARHHRFDPARVINTCPALARASLIEDSTSVTTARQYASRMEVLRRWCEARGLAIDHLSKEDLFLFLADLRDQGMASAEGYRSAFLQYQRKIGVRSWAEDKDVILAVKAVARKSFGEKVEKGSPTPAMLAAALTRCGNDPDVECALRVGFGAALRVSQLKSLRASSLQRDEEDVGQSEHPPRGMGCLMSRWTLCLSVDKRARAQATGHQAHLKPITEEAAAVISSWVQKRGLHPRDFLFPRDIGRRLSAALSEAARYFGWPSDLAWGGTHVLRTGGSREIVHRVEGALQELTSQQKVRTLRAYARSNAQRRKVAPSN